MELSVQYIVSPSINGGCAVISTFSALDGVTVNDMPSPSPTIYTYDTVNFAFTYVIVKEPLMPSSTGFPLICVLQY